MEDKDSTVHQNMNFYSKAPIRVTKLLTLLALHPMKMVWIFQNQLS